MHNHAIPFCSFFFFFLFVCCFNPPSPQPRKSLDGVSKDLTCSSCCAIYTLAKQQHMQPTMGSRQTRCKQAGYIFNSFVCGLRVAVRSFPSSVVVVRRS
ncbi:hypothetical protein QBC44DRAFT_334063 [Cladorrhinum sp. PSN332]|nr:hypothetical protein QBC44DRAFT_334063 [Cladorrhinum sp. PSN332]